MIDIPTAPLSSRIDNDKVMTVRRQAALSSAGNVLDALREDSAELAVAALAVAFFVASERFAGGPEELYHVGRKIIQPVAHDPKANAMADSLTDLATKLYRKKDTF